jgi:hypothetical protein
MSNYASNATITLSVNGKQAQNMLKQLQSEAAVLAQKIDKAATAGDKATMKKLQRELNSTNRAIRQIQTSAKNVDDVLRRLNTATPKELNSTLRTLKAQLNNIERGSSAWKAHVEKIRQVKEELRRVNSDLQESKSGFAKIGDFLKGNFVGIASIGAAVAGIKEFASQAVEAYTQISEAMANTRKYTGLSAEAVDELNKSFAQWDTRTSRETLNELAQEAGRLGYNTLDSVKEYVEAANIINVALDDLGEGATQEIAKLSDIFNIQDTLGTRDAMLAVGSTVNDLSQCCTASAPYIVEFTKRLAGVGSQAKMTIPEIMGLAATLDANGQKVEISSSALMRTIMKLFQKPAEIAQAVGMDVQTFTETVQRSTNEGLIMFLQRLNEIGSDDALAALSPLFKDLGMDGVGLSSTLSVLSGKIEMVKDMQAEANKAFAEGTSVINEYDVFNSTAQANIDKTKKSITDLSASLGEKLYPVSLAAYKTTEGLLYVVNAIADFFRDYWKALAVCLVSLAAYSVAVNLATIKTKIFAAAHATGAALMKAWNAVTLLASAAANLFTGNITKATTSFKAFSAAIKASPVGLATAAITAAVSALALLIVKLNSVKSAQEMVNDINKKASERYVEQKQKIDNLLSVAQNETASLDERRKAINALNEIIPNYNAQLDATTGKYKANKAALDKYLESLLKQYQIEGAREQIKELSKKKAQNLVDIQEAKETITSLNTETSNYYQSSAGRPQTTSVPSLPSAPTFQMGMSALKEGAQKRITTLTNKNKTLDSQINTIINAFGTEAIVDNSKGGGAKTCDECGTTLNADGSCPNPDCPKKHKKGGGGGGGNGKGSGSTTGKTNKFAAEEEWEKTQKAYARIARATGTLLDEQGKAVTDKWGNVFLFTEADYAERMNDIDVQYYKKLLEREDLTQQERLDFTAKYWEAVNKQTETNTQNSLDAQEEGYAEAKAITQQDYVDGRLSKEAYDAEMERLELDHLKTLASIGEAGTPKRLEAERKYNDKLIAIAMERRRKTEETERKTQEALAKVKDEYFGDTPAEQKAKYEHELDLLEQVYAAEIKAAGDNAEERLRIEEQFLKAQSILRKRYNQGDSEDSKNSYSEAINASVEWLNGDGGKALTGTINTLVSGMSSIFSQVSSMVQSEMEAETATVEKRYEKEISAAEGNSYKVKKLEKQKEKELAKIKADANRKMFAMQVIQAVAQVATNALNAYGSAAAIPVVGHVLAPIAAAMAVAAGALQVAAIKKQQQASEAQGYSEGGFTPDGDKDKAVGVVHAGEWVASQRLTKNPKTRPLLEALEYAQRNNTIGSLTAADVSKAITAPMILAGQASQPAATIINNVTNTASMPGLSEYAEVMDKLKSRLDEPLISITTLTGEIGITKAQSDYAKLIRNKTPKNKR